MPHLALSAVGRDRPGIVAGVSGVLLEHGVNIEDSQMAVLRGCFAMMLVLAVPAGLDEGALRAGLERARADLGLASLTLDAVPEEVQAPAQPGHVISVYGIDHPGIVHAVAAALAGQGVNITDLRTHLVSGGDPPLYAMMLEVGGAEPDAVALARIAAAEGVELSVRPLERDEL